MADSAAHPETSAVTGESEESPRARALRLIGDLPAREKYTNRELSWLRFNMRVLEEAFNESHPPLERLRFLSISGSNLDEFYMVRVAGLRGLMDSGVEAVSDDGLTPAQQLAQVNKLAETLMEEQQRCWVQLRQELGEAGIAVLDAQTVTAQEDIGWLEQYFLDNVFPVLTPLAIDPAHPFPFLPNLSFSLVLCLERPSDGKTIEALLPVPEQVSRFIRLPGEGVRFVPLEVLITLFLDKLFPGYEVAGSGVFRIIRDSDVEIEEEAEDLIRLFETALKRRRRGRVIRLKIDRDMPRDLADMVIEQLDADGDTVTYVGGILGICETKQLIVDDLPELKFSPYNPRYPERVRDHGGDIFKAVRAKDFVVHHPYESFDVVHAFLRQAARDPEVVAIKQTLYRAGSQSEIIDALNEKLADKLFVNFSLFQSLPDVWGIDQVFPILPLRGLQRPLTRRAVIQDITCDSDGRIDLYVDGQGLETTLPLPEDDGEPLLLGFFMTGAYQEILGDMHNLFGDTHSVDVRRDEDGSYRISETIAGDTVAKILRYVNFEPEQLLQAYRRKFARSDLDALSQERLLAELESGLHGYTYLED